MFNFLRNVAKFVFGRDEKELPNVPAIMRRPSKKDAKRTPAMMLVYSKLGASFFTRRLNPAVRWSRIRSLSPSQLLLARHKGWL